MRQRTFEIKKPSFIWFHTAFCKILRTVRCSRNSRNSWNAYTYRNLHKLCARYVYELPLLQQKNCPFNVSKLLCYHALLALRKISCTSSRTPYLKNSQKWFSFIRCRFYSRIPVRIYHNLFNYKTLKKDAWPGNGKERTVKENSIWNYGVYS